MDSTIKLIEDCKKINVNDAILSSLYYGQLPCLLSASSDIINIGLSLIIRITETLNKLDRSNRQLTEPLRQKPLIFGSFSSIVK